MSLFSSSWTYAFPCYLTFIKNSCWKNYTVTVDVIDTKNNKKMATITVPINGQWARGQFECASTQTFGFVASFSPSIWESDVGKTYNATHYWSPPVGVVAGEVAWNIGMCFPNDFSEVPMPPDSTGKCVCDKSNIPPIEVKK